MLDNALVHVRVAGGTEVERWKRKVGILLHLGSAYIDFSRVANLEFPLNFHNINIKKNSLFDEIANAVYHRHHCIIALFS